MSVVWHDLECGRYDADLPLWRQLAAAADGPILDVGAGTGRVTLPLARAGAQLTALDSDAVLLAELERRAAGLTVRTVCADARDFALSERFALIIVPMQTVQLLGGAAGRLAFLRCAAAHLRPGGSVAIAIAEELEPFEVGPGVRGPLPDICERDGVLYSSLPTAVRLEGDAVWLERDRETVSPDGTLLRDSDRIRLDLVSAGTLEREGGDAGLAVRPRIEIAPTAEHVGSRVVMLSG
ncbi:MAG TPA: class I SAM-dependent methyltransferase [Solirubrobacteraceae bacterium]|nr:class I SAM-dependent methyltransferase [Solirubrobacteraceae bacterium]